jgi:hypothetical protein
MATIQTAVGRGVKSVDAADVLQVQKLLNRHRMPPLSKIGETGKINDETIAAIEDFQRRVVKMKTPDGRVDPKGKTLTFLSDSPPGATPVPSGLAHWLTVFGSAAGDFIPKTAGPPPANTHGPTFTKEGASGVALSYGKNAVPLNSKAETLLKSILASVGMSGATVTSTLRTYHDQARITMTQTYKASPDKVKTWYGQAVLDACIKYKEKDDIQGFADWWKEHDTKRGKVSSKHLTNRALDVVPNGDRAKFARKVKELIPVTGSGVQRIIPKGTMGEPVDHVEFTFAVTDQSS